MSAHTLPRNFTFHYHDGELPKTPEPSDNANIFPQRTSPPPAPPARVAREPYRLRRRRAPVQAAQRAIRAIHRDEIMDSFRADQDTPLPSIELTDSAGMSAVLSDQSAPANPFFSPPKTPVAQIYGSEETNREASSSLEDLTRPSTACSGFSDSSKSSSIESFPSFGESCSPKSQHDPFTTNGTTFGLMTSPLQEYGACPSFPQSRRPAWTQEMDEHLWITYMRYLQDPTHTPFKMLPGTAPPPGVCSRVVKEAKRTWKGHLTSSVPKVHRFARWGTNRAESPEARPAAVRENGDRRSNVPWPRSDSATRKRLRDLCKLKPTLSAHYGRLLHARSPSPFLTSNIGRSTSAGHDIASPRASTGCAFSTRDMNISLAASVSTTMQPTHPLVQLGNENPASEPAVQVPQIIHPQDATTPRPRAITHDFRAAPRTPSHQKSQSMHESSSTTVHPRPLASPFRPMPLKTSTHAPLQSAVANPNQSSTLTLAAPVELHAPVPRRSFFKRPASQQLNDMMHSEDPYTRQHHLMRELFGSDQPIEVSHRRVRSRGFSLGDMSAASRLESLFTSSDEPAPVVAPPSTRPITNTLLSAPSIDGVVARLGSPFAEKPAPKTHFNTFPRNFSLIGLEPAMDIAEDSGEQPMTNAGSP